MKAADKVAAETIRYMKDNTDELGEAMREEAENIIAEEHDLETMPDNALLQAAQEVEEEIESWFWILFSKMAVEVVASRVAQGKGV